MPLDSPVVMDARLTDLELLSVSAMTMTQGSPVLLILRFHFRIMTLIPNYFTLVLSKPNSIHLLEISFKIAPHV